MSQNTINIRDHLPPSALTGFRLFGREDAEAEKIFGKEKFLKVGVILSGWHSYNKYYFSKDNLATVYMMFNHIRKKLKENGSCIDFFKVKYKFIVDGNMMQRSPSCIEPMSKEEREEYWKKWYAARESYRQPLQDEIFCYLSDLAIDQKIKNLAIAIIRYKVGYYVGDRSGD